jgi:hypothetical protein
LVAAQHNMISAMGLSALKRPLVERKIRALKWERHTWVPAEKSEIGQSRILSSGLT